MSVCLFASSHEKTWLLLDDFHEIWYLANFKKKFDKFLVSLRTDKYNGYFTWRDMYMIDIPLNSS
jgi:hypothetical protein